MLLEADWVIRSFVDEVNSNQFYEMVKRLIDILGGLVGVFFFVCLFPFIALAIFLDDGKPIFYKQVRTGRGGQSYAMLKFRTMRRNAEADGMPKWATESDERATRVGRLLRKTHLDEIPQLFNVLRGEMSIVGPRAERPELVSYFLNQDPLPEVISDPAQTQTGFQMWHVSGQGITEQWGARVTEETGERGLPYIYQSPYAIINAGTADLYLTKLFPGDDDDPDHKCPGGQSPVYPADYPFEPVWIEGVGWSGTCNLPVVPYTIEQSVSGKFVHGYNWRVRDLPDHLETCVDQAWRKSGWWRLTYVPNGDNSKMVFTDNTKTGPPEIPSAVPTALSAFLSFLEESEEDDEEGTLAGLPGRPAALSR